MTVSVLFARADSHYKALPGCDVWDEARDASLRPGGAPEFAAWLVELARRCAK